MASVLDCGEVRSRNRRMATVIITIRLIMIEHFEENRALHASIQQILIQEADLSKIISSIQRLLTLGIPIRHSLPRSACFLGVNGLRTIHLVKHMTSVNRDTNTLFCKTRDEKVGVRGVRRNTRNGERKTGSAIVLNAQLTVNLQLTSLRKTHLDRTEDRNGYRIERTSVKTIAINNVI